MKFRRFSNPRPTCLYSVDSTQSYLALELEDKREGDFVVSDVQRRGRGREGRTWVSDDGGLYFSIMLSPKRPDIVDRITATAANVVKKTLDSDWGLEGCYVKNPNDVVYRGKKIAGVLVDAELRGVEAIAYLGIGVDLNNGESWGEPVREIATSYLLEKGTRINLDEFLLNILWRLDLEYDRLFSLKPSR